MATAKVSSDYFHNMNSQVHELSHIWDTHRKEVDELIARASSIISIKQNAIIVGAGNLNDITLDFLLNNYDNVKLLDIDEKSLLNVLNRYEGNNVNLNIIVEDLTGVLSDKFVGEYYEGLLMKDNAKITKIFNDIIVNGICKKTIFEEKYSLLIESTVSTQLGSLFTLCWQELNPSPIFEESIRQLIRMMTKSHLLQLKHGLDKMGLAVITSEQYEFGNNLPTVKYIPNPVDMLEENLQSKMESLGHYVRGRITEDDLIEADFNIIFRNQWIWRFNEERTYLVKGWVVSRNF
ncbi:hypothetical protein IFU39_13775 [Paenibacillus sp. CFBP 13594]|uniref:hypothetical protein n=1 Tax=Paenibacillus sp. CFBP 13594 TaxID=2774037 RepID=UPI0017815753|nr:hypothetical protein [Paenibacillus sp. CFBP 13594]MBD8838885.1 hypothetical protein [Paenibacillus sp. CFBP 13594]